ncbi:PREDICTED: mitogen-activated protein kinase kinase 8-like [Camelina sativa]|uniref:mitogen-activated protein kinase kinase n=1 Tax=Camelina sativa TaxID=90675 RepID=A0ABM0SYI7_CAMSA|nr:PREDICTED: mitogen-activated protein kinase kinase 8-like [Camelina sativa]
MVLVRNPGFLNLKLQPPTTTPPTFPSYFPIAAASMVTSCASNNISTTDLDRINVLGSGNGGTVFKVKNKTTSEIYALKKIKEDMDSTSRQQLLREIEILRLVNSSSIVKCHDIFQNTSGEVSILMDYMDLGTLESLRGKVVTEDQLALMARQILQGLNYLHELKIVHRDIKPANLLRSSKEEVKIADFGVSKIVAKSLNKCNSFVGTYAYMSPERLDSEAEGVTEEDRSNVYAGDIWSFGLTMLEILVGYYPLLPQGQKPDQAAIICAVCFGEPPKAPEECSDELKSFIDCCLRKKASERWTASQLLNHPFLQHQD